MRQEVEGTQVGGMGHVEPQGQENGDMSASLACGVQPSQGTARDGDPADWQLFRSPEPTPGESWVPGDHGAPNLPSGRCCPHTAEEETEAWRS